MCLTDAAAPFWEQQIHKKENSIQFVHDFFFHTVGTSNFYQQTHYMKIHSKVQILEEKTKEAERIAELAEADAREKDKELVEALKRLKDYESVSIFILSVRELSYSDSKLALWLVLCPMEKTFWIPAPSTRQTSQHSLSVKRIASKPVFLLKKSLFYYYYF